LPSGVTAPMPVTTTRFNSIEAMNFVKDTISQKQLDLQSYAV
jgi:hypothetical protein